MPPRKTQADRESEAQTRAEIVRLLRHHYPTASDLAAAAQVSGYSNDRSKVRAWLNNGAAPAEPHRKAIVAALNAVAPADAARLGDLYQSLDLRVRGIPTNQSRRAPLHNLVPRPSPLLTGRGDALSAVAQQLSHLDQRPVVALVGTGGVGKSSVAAAFAQQHGSVFDVIWWATAPDPYSLTVALASLAHASGACDADVPISVAASAARKYLADINRWLLIVDAAGVIDGYLTQLPAAGTGMTIVTSQRTGWDPLATEIQLDVLSPEDGAEFLLRRASRDDAKPSRQVSVALGGLPLALEQAGAYVARKPGVDYNDYLGLLHQHGLGAFPLTTKPVDYAHTVATVWNLSIAAAHAELPDSRIVLEHLSLLAATPIPDVLIDAFGEVADFASGIDVLNSYSLVTRHPHSVTMHALTQRVVRDAMTTTKMDKPLRGIANALQTVLRADSTNWKQFEISRQLDAHAEALLQQSPNNPSTADAVARAATRAANFARGRGDLDYAVTTHEQVLDYATTHDASHEIVLQTRSALASDHYAADRYGIAAEHFLANYEESKTLDLPAVMRADIAGAAAVAMFTLEEFSKAVEFADIATGIINDAPDATETQRITHRSHALLARMRLDQPTHQSWAELYEYAKTHLGPDHHHALAVQHNLGLSYQQAKEINAARATYEEVIARSAGTLGPDHHSTRKTQMTLQALNEQFA
jgi:tetratricopeptide (TPR) repeat protein